MIALEGRRSELEADRNTYVTLLGKLKTGSDAGRAEALRALATSPALGRQSVDQLAVQSAEQLPVPPRLDDDGPVGRRADQSRCRSVAYV